MVVEVFPSGDNVNGTRQRAPGALNLDSLRAAAKTEADSLRVEELAAPPMVSAQHLTPQKARILLMLALTQTRDPREVQRYFREY